MKRDEIEKVLKEIDPANLKTAIDAIMALYGSSVTTLQLEADKVKPLQTEVETFKTQLETANGTIAGYKGMKPEDIAISIAKYEGEAKTAREKAESEVALIRLQTDVERELQDTYGALKPSYITPKLDFTKIKKTEKGFDGLEDQIKPIKEKDTFMFGQVQQQKDETGKPRFSSKTTDDSKQPPTPETFGGAIKDALFPTAG